MTHYMVAIIAFGELSGNKISHVFISLNINHQIILPYETPTFAPTHIILSGGPKHVYKSDHYPMPQWVLDSNNPVLGICYGMQLIAYTFGGIVIQMPEKESGLVPVTEIIDDKQVTHMKCMNRYDRVLMLPKEFSLTGITDRGHIATFTDFKRWWAVQYHPESIKYRDINVFRRFLDL